MQIVMSFDIATKKTGVAILNNQKISTLTIKDTKTFIQKENFLNVMFKALNYTYEKDDSFLIIFENLAVGRNGILFAEIIGYFKSAFLSITHNIHFQTISPNKWMYALFKKKLSRKEGKLKSLEIAKQDNIDVEGDDNRSDAYCILKYFLTYGDN